MAVPILAWVGLREESSWRYFVLFCSIPCILSTILSIAWVPESPRWLMTQGKHEQALVILRKAATTNGLNAMEVFPEGTILVDSQSYDDEIHSITALLSPEWRTMTLMLWATWTGLAFLYWGTIQMVTIIFFDTNSSNKSSGHVIDFDYGAIFASSCAEILGQTCVICLIHRSQRTHITSIMYLMGGIFVFVLCWAVAERDVPRQTLVVLSFLARGFAMGASSMTWVITAELLPTQIRATGHSTANGVARLGGAVSPFLVNPSVDFRLIGTVMGCVSLVTSIVAWNLPETSGQTMGTAGKKQGFLDDDRPVMESEII